MLRSYHIIGLPPQVWAGPAADVVEGHDETGTSIIPTDYGVTEDVDENLPAYYVEHDQATAASDTSVDLSTIAQGGNENVVKSGNLWHTFVHGRSVDGDTITARFYIDGAAVGSPVTFSHTEHELIDLGVIQHTLDDALAGNTLTLRFSGGLVRLGSVILLGRAVEILAKDYIDTSDGAALVTDADAPRSSGSNNTVQRTPSPTADILIDGYEILEDGYYHHAVVSKAVASGAHEHVDELGDQTYCPYLFLELFGGGEQPVSHGVTSNLEYLINGVHVGSVVARHSAWTQWVLDGGVTQARSHAYNTNPATAVSSLLAGGGGFAASAGDIWGLQIDANSLRPRQAWLDAVFLCRQTNDPEVDYETSDLTGDPLSIVFSHEDVGPDSGSLADHFEGRVYDSEGTQVGTTEDPITSPWSVDLSGLDDGNYYAVVVAVYPDGAEAWALVSFTAGGFVPHIYRYSVAGTR